MTVQFQSCGPFSPFKTAGSKWTLMTFIGQIEKQHWTDRPVSLDRKIGRHT